MKTLFEKIWFTIGVVSMISAVISLFCVYCELLNFEKVFLIIIVIPFAWFAITILLIVVGEVIINKIWGCKNFHTFPSIFKAIY